MMQFVEQKNGRTKVLLNEMPTKQQLRILNKKSKDFYFIDSSRGYNFLACKSSSSTITMESPIGTWFIL